MAKKSNCFLLSLGFPQATCSFGYPRSSGKIVKQFSLQSRLHVACLAASD